MMPTDYIAAGWALVPIPSGQKGPNTPGWNQRENCVTTPEQLPRITGNVGLAHVYSGTCALDIDDLERTRKWLKAEGVDIDELLADPLAVRIDSGRPNRAKLLYSLPSPLASVKIDRGAFELRCATKFGTSTQDVLPPSTHPDTGKPYEWRFDELLTDPVHPPPLPASLHALWLECLTPTVLEQPALSATVSYAYVKQLLAKHDPDSEYDHWLRVGMALHNDVGADGLILWNEWSAQGSKYVSLEDLEKHWRSFGRSPNPVTLASLRVQEPATADEFDVVTPEAPNSNRFTIVKPSELLGRTPPGWLVKHVIPRSGLVVVYGASTSGKSFAMLDLSYAVGTGSDWRDRRTTKGRVVYVVAEGVGGFQKRIQAAQLQGVLVDAIDLITSTPNILQANDVRELIASIGTADMIVLDTFAQVTPGANENASEDMGKALGHCRILHRETGATVVLVHHSGKDESKGARGWSGLRAAADAELEVSNFEGARMIRVTKQKDGEDGAIYPFKLATVELGIDDDGDPIKSAIVEHVDALPSARSPARREPGPVGKVILEVVADLLGVDVEGFVAIPKVITESVARLPHDPQAGRDQRRGRVARGIERLISEAWLLAKDNEVTLLRAT